MIDLSKKKVGEIIPILYWVKDWHINCDGAVTSSKPSIEVRKYTNCKLTDYDVVKGGSTNYTLKGVDENGKECLIWYSYKSYSSGDEKVEWLFEDKNEAYIEYIRYVEIWRKHLINNIKLKLTKDLEEVKKKYGF